LARYEVLKPLLALFLVLFIRCRPAPAIGISVFITLFRIPVDLAADAPDDAHLFFAGPDTGEELATISVKVLCGE